MPMHEHDKAFHIFFSAAEPSADAHCAALIAGLKKTGRSLEFTGFGGPKMASAGCRLLETTTDKAAMAYNAFSKILYFRKLIGRAKSFFNKNKIDLVIVCDSPAFNFHIAKKAKKSGIKTLFYVAPQLWAWAPWRIYKLRKRCDKLVCILPFEEAWFKSRGIDATYVGHPLLAESNTEHNARKKDYAGFDPQKVKILLLPGSRNAEIDTLWKPMQQIVLRLRRKFPGLEVTTVALDEKTVQKLKSRYTVGFRCSYTTGSVSDAACDADFAIVASGTATLQVAAAGCPLVVMYQSSRLLWHLLGRWLIRTKYLSLVNILAEKELVTEFMPYFKSIDPIVRTIEEMLRDKNRLSQFSGELVDVTGPLCSENASQKTAQIVTELLC